MFEMAVKVLLPRDVCMFALKILLPPNIGLLRFVLDIFIDLCVFTFL